MPPTEKKGKEREREREKKSFVVVDGSTRPWREHALPVSGSSSSRDRFDSIRRRRRRWRRRWGVGERHEGSCSVLPCPVVSCRANQ